MADTEIDVHRTLLLAFLAERPAHGYELVQRLGEVGIDMDRARYSMVYRRLYALEAAGCVVSGWDLDTDHAGPRRKVYRITAKGVRALRQEARALRKLSAAIDEALPRRVGRLA